HPGAPAGVLLHPLVEGGEGRVDVGVRLLRPLHVDPHRVDLRLLGVVLHALRAVLRDDALPLLRAPLELLDALELNEVRLRRVARPRNVVPAVERVPAGPPALLLLEAE